MHRYGFWSARLHEMSHTTSKTTQSAQKAGGTASPTHDAGTKRQQLTTYDLTSLSGFVGKREQESVADAKGVTPKQHQINFAHKGNLLPNEKVSIMPFGSIVLQALRSGSRVNKLYGECLQNADQAIEPTHVLDHVILLSNKRKQFYSEISALGFGQIACS